MGYQVDLMCRNLSPKNMSVVSPVSRHNPKLWLQPFLIVATTHDGGLLEARQLFLWPRIAFVGFTARNVPPIVVLVASR